MYCDYFGQYTYRHIDGMKSAMGKKFVEIDFNMELMNYGDWTTSSYQVQYLWIVPTNPGGNNAFSSGFPNCKMETENSCYLHPSERSGDRVQLTQSRYTETVKGDKNMQSLTFSHSPHPKAWSCTNKTGKPLLAGRGCPFSLYPFQGCTAFLGTQAPTRNSFNNQTVVLVKYYEEDKPVGQNLWSCNVSFA